MYNDSEDARSKRALLADAVISTEGDARIPACYISHASIACLDALNASQQVPTTSLEAATD